MPKQVIERRTTDKILQCTQQTQTPQDANYCW